MAVNCVTGAIDKRASTLAVNHRDVIK